MYIQNEIDQGIEVLDRAPIAHFGPFDPERLSLTVDAFTRGALVVDGLIEGTLAIQQGPHQSALFLIGIFDTTFAPGELGMVTGLARRRWIEQRTAIALRDSRWCAETGRWDACASLPSSEASHQGREARPGAHGC